MNARRNKPALNPAFKRFQCLPLWPTTAATNLAAQTRDLSMRHLSQFGLPLPPTPAIDLPEVRAVEE